MIINKYLTYICVRSSKIDDMSHGIGMFIQKSVEMILRMMTFKLKIYRYLKNTYKNTNVDLSDEMGKISSG